MHDIERRVWREARAMTRREVITKQLSWVQAAEILGISARHMRDGYVARSNAVACRR